MKIKLDESDVELFVDDLLTDNLDLENTQQLLNDFGQSIIDVDEDQPEVEYNLIREDFVQIIYRIVQSAAKDVKLRKLLENILNNSIEELEEEEEE